jgi:hypothetical protein
MTDDGAPLTLTGLVRTWARGWRTLAAGALAGLLLGTLMHVVLPQTWTATASVRVDPTAVDPLAEQQGGRPVDMATEERLAASGAVAGDRRVEVQAVADSAVLRIAVTAGSPRRAAAGADLVARAYVEQRSQRAAAAVARARAVLDRQVDALHDRTSAQAQQLTAELARSDRLRTDGGEVIESARPPDRGDRPGLLLSCVAGCLVGLLCAAAATAWRRNPAGVVVLDVDAGASPDLRQGLAAFADHVIVLRDGDADLDVAQLWCERLRSVGISASVVTADPPGRS